MIVAIGVDSIEIARIRRMLDDGGRFAARIYAAAERAYCEGRNDPAESYAARFAAKEAVMKCLGTGWGQGVRFVDIEVLRGDAGRPSLALTGIAAQTAAARGIRRWHLSLSHTGTAATAFVVAEG